MTNSAIRAVAPCLCANLRLLFDARRIAWVTGFLSFLTASAIADSGAAEDKGGGDLTFEFCLSAEQIEPPIEGTLPTSSGTATLTYNDTDGTFFMRVEHDVANPTGYRLGFAPAQAFGNIVYTSGTVTTNIFDLSLPMSSLSPADETDFRNGLIYVEVLSEGYPEGEIRGQLEDRPCVTFEDPDFEAAVRDEISLPTVPYPEDFVDSGFTRLRIFGEEIDSLTGIEYATDLTEITLYNSNRVTDLSPLANLTNLEILFLQFGRATDISPLANLTNLRELDLNSNPVTDLSPLANLTNLEDLVLHVTRASDISALENLTNLLELRMINTPVSDLSALAGLTQLTDLDLSETRVSDLSPLAGLTALLDLDVSYSPVDDLSAVAGMTSLLTLNVNATLITDISPWPPLTV